MYPDAYIGRGWAYYLQGNLEAALEDFSHVLRAVPDDLYAMTNRAITYAKGGELEAAYADYQAAIEIESGQGDAGEGVIALAITDLTDAIERDPQNPNFYLFRGYLEYSQADFEAAVADWDEVKRLGGDFVGEIQALYDLLT